VIQRERADRCPGLCRPWIATDGALVRLRLIGGRTTRDQLTALAAVAARYGDPNLFLTRRANVQVRGLPAVDGRLTDEVAEALRATGLLPSATHELVRNVMVSPLTGIDGGEADLRRTATELDATVCADPRLAGLPGRFLFVLDDGRGDVAGRPLDLGLVALDAEKAQLRAGTGGWGPVVPLAEAPAALAGLAHAFLDRRGAGESAAWHVDELAEPLVEDAPAAGALERGGPAPYGRGRGYEHRQVPDGVLSPGLLGTLPDGPVVVSPWHGLVVTDR